MVKPFDSYDGIEKVVSGYTGGNLPNPTYEQVCSNATGHFEAVQITYDPEKFSYDQLLDIFWLNIDPTDEEGQFFDKGSSYQTAIFYHNEEQQEKAEQSKAALNASGRFPKKIATKILPASEFYEAEEYHQDYYKKNPSHYNRYFVGSGRANFVENNRRLQNEG